MEVIEKDHMLLLFPENTQADLYMWIIRHWDYLKKDNPEISITDASRDYERKYGKGIMKRWMKRLVRRFSSED